MRSSPDARPNGAGNATPEDLHAAVQRLSRASVLVVGDVMLDRWVHGEVQRISPEAPIPVLGVARETDAPGGAGNVVRNLGALGAAVAFVSVVGDDQAGSDLTGLIGGQQGVEPWLLVQGGRTTTQKTRFVAHGQQILRTDREHADPVHPKLAERLLRIAHEAMAATSVTILSDYRKGVLAGDVGRALVESARKMGRPVVVAMRGPDFAAYAGADLLLTGWRDLARADGLPAETDAAVVRAAARLREAHGIGTVIVVRSGYDLTMVTGADGGPGVHHFRNRAPELVDGSGAGDSAVAVLGAALATGIDVVRATELASLACSVAAGRMGTALVRTRDLLAALSPRAAAKVLDPETAAERAERWRRAGLSIGFAQGAFAPLADCERAAFETARAGCDRLVVAVDVAGQDPAAHQERATLVAALPSVDLVILDDGRPAGELLRSIHPDMLLDASEPARGGAAGELVRGWGGSVMVAEAPAVGG